MPKGLLQALHMSHEATTKVIAEPGVDHVAFTGSVRRRHAVERAAAGRFMSVGLELGGKDPAYVRADANLAHAIENLVDGAFFNSGQSCCGIERIYVHASAYDRFVEGAVELTRTYVLGDPTQADTTLGPMVRTSAADFVRGQIGEAVGQGAARCWTRRPSPRPGPARPISHRRSWWTSTIPCALCARRRSVPPWAS